jgi:hypothetical protein
VDAVLRHLLHARDGALGVLLVVERDDLDVVGGLADLNPPSSFSQAARASIERWLEMPQAAAGPEVTPTKPIFSVAFSAQAALVAVRASARDRPVVARKRVSSFWCSLLSVCGIRVRDTTIDGLADTIVNKMFRMVHDVPLMG